MLLVVICSHYPTPLHVVVLHIVMVVVEMVAVVAVVVDYNLDGSVKAVAYPSLTAITFIPFVT